MICYLHKVAINLTKPKSLVLISTVKDVRRKLASNMSNRDVAIGRVAFIKRFIEQKTTVDSHVTIVRANINKILSEYLSWTMLHYQPIIELASNGSTE